MMTSVCEARRLQPYSGSKVSTIDPLCGLYTVGVVIVSWPAQQ